MNLSGSPVVIENDVIYYVISKIKGSSPKAVCHQDAILAPYCQLWVKYTVVYIYVQCL